MTSRRRPSPSVLAVLTRPTRLLVLVDLVLVVRSGPDSETGRRPPLGRPGATTTLTRAWAPRRTTWPGPASTPSRSASAGSRAAAENNDNWLIEGEVTRHAPGRRALSSRQWATRRNPQPASNPLSGGG